MAALQMQRDVEAAKTCGWVEEILEAREMLYTTIANLERLAARAQTHTMAIEPGKHNLLPEELAKTNNALLAALDGYTALASYTKYMADKGAMV